MSTFVKYPRVLAAELATLKPTDLIKKIERGDSDTTGSTIRTAGAVFLVLVVVAGIVAAVTTLGGKISASINGAPWP
jgi:hypothetical protein